MFIRVFGDDDIELTTARIDSISDLPRVCREQCGVGDEEWPVERWSGTKYKCQSANTVLWVDVGADVSGE